MDTRRQANCRLSHHRAAGSSPRDLPTAELARHGARSHRVWTVAFVLAWMLGGLTPVQPVRAGSDGQEEYVVVKAGRVITVSGEEISPGTVVIVDGKISLVGGDLEYPASAKIIDAKHETVMPGFVLPRTRFQLAGYKRSGVHGDQNVASEIYLSQMRFDDLIEAGYTTACFVPTGKGIPGMACAFRTAGPKDLRKLGDAAYLEVATYWDAGAKGKEVLRAALKKAKEEIEKVEKAQKEWEEKQKAAEEAEQKKDDEEKPKDDDGDDDDDDDEDEDDDQSVAHKGGDEPEEGDNGDDDNGDDDGKEQGEPAKQAKFEPPPIDPKHQPLVDLIQHKDGALMMVRLARASDLHHLDDVLKPYEDLPYTLYAAEWGRTTYFQPVIEELGKREAKIVVKPSLNRLPYTTFRYNLMDKLAEAGCEVSALPSWDSRIEYRRMRMYLAELVRSGLSREDALKSLTLHPARAIGLGDRLGSLEKDKDADLLFFNGDPLDPKEV